MDIPQIIVIADIMDIVEIVDIKHIEVIKEIMVSLMLQEQEVQERRFAQLVS